MIIRFYLKQKCMGGNFISYNAFIFIFTRSFPKITHANAVKHFKRKQNKKNMSRRALWKAYKYLMDVLCGVTWGLTWHCCLFVYVGPKGLKLHDFYSEVISNKHFWIKALSPSYYYIALVTPTAILSSGHMCLCACMCVLLMTFQDDHWGRYTREERYAKATVMF